MLVDDSWEDSKTGKGKSKNKGTEIKAGLVFELPADTDRSRANMGEVVPKRLPVGGRTIADQAPRLYLDAAPASNIASCHLVPKITGYHRLSLPA